MRGKNQGAEIKFKTVVGDSLKNIRLEKIDFRAVRERGNEVEQHRLAERAFHVLRPLYGHLTEAEYTAILHGVVLDATPVVFRGFFMTDGQGRDLGLSAVRIGEAIHDGQTIAHLTVHLGLHAEARGERHSEKLIWKEIFRYRLKHPFRPFFIIDTPISAASYRKMFKGAAQIFPTPGNPIPENLWPLCDAVAQGKKWASIEGCPKEARLVNRPLTALSVNDARPTSQAYLSIERWFNETTRGVSGSAVMVIVPITLSNMVMTAWKQARHFFKKRKSLAFN